MTPRGFKKVLRYNATPVKFKYKKKDGSIREAVGTTNFDLVPEEHQPKLADARAAEGLVKYYDTEKNGWRSAVEENLISFFDDGSNLEIMID